MVESKAPADITFLDVVEAVEGDAPTFVCSEIRKNNPCLPKGYTDARPCGIARVMWEADEAWRAKLRSYTIQDLAQMLGEGVPADLLQKSFDWLLSRN